MSAERVFIGLGSNLAGPAGQVRDAIQAVASLAPCTLRRCSRLYRTAPWGISAQPPFVNAVLELTCSASPQALMQALLAIEAAAGRRRSVRWGPRVIDLDLLAWGSRRIEEPALCVPHPRLSERDFVLVPWAEIAPAFEVPGQGRVSELLAALGTTHRMTPQPIEERPPCTAAPPDAP